jgi:hypothetical protein
MQDELVRSAVHKHGAPSRINRSSQRGSGIGYVPFLRLVKRPGRPVSRVGLIEQVRPLAHALGPLPSRIPCTPTSRLCTRMTHRVIRFGGVDD